MTGQLLTSSFCCNVGLQLTLDIIDHQYCYNQYVEPLVMRHLRNPIIIIEGNQWSIWPNIYWFSFASSRNSTCFLKVLVEWRIKICLAINISNISTIIILNCFCDSCTTTEQQSNLKHKVKFLNISSLEN